MEPDSGSRFKEQWHMSNPAPRRFRGPFLPEAFRHHFDMNKHNTLPILSTLFWSWSEIGLYVSVFVLYHNLCLRVSVSVLCLLREAEGNLFVQVCTDVKQIL